MKITIISHNYAPEDSGIGLYSTGMAEYLAKKHELSVITAFPYYPQWSIPTEYKDKPCYFLENINGVQVYRYKMFMPSEPNFTGRVKQMLSFLRGSLKNIKSIKEADVVMVVVPFTLSIHLGKKLARKTQAKIWVHVQDFEFDAAIETGILGSVPFAKEFLKQIENQLFSKTDIQSSISHSMLNKLPAKNPEKLYLLPNWIDGNLINPEFAQISEIFPQGAFNILYSGNIGAKQDWDTFVSLVKRARFQEDFYFTIIGDGAYKKELKAKMAGLGNVQLLDPVPYEMLNDVLCSTDFHILTQKAEVVDTVMPSKILGMMASAKPSLVTGNEQSEVHKIFMESKGGIFKESTNADELLEVLQYYQKNKSLAQEMGINARRYVLNNFDKETILSQLDAKLMSL